MRRSLTFAVIIQGSGAVLAILTVFGMARYLGATYQGSFAIYKNWFDLVSSSLLFGAPQGIIYAINKNHISLAFAARMSVVFALATLPISFVINLAGAQLNYLPDDRGVASYVMIAVGCSGYVYHGLARSIFLTQRDGVSFSALTVLPTAGISIILVVQGLLFVPSMDLAFTINGVMCALVAFGSIDRARGGGMNRSTSWKSVIFRQSAHSFAQGFVISLQPLSIYALIRLSGGGVHDVGLFSYALIILVSVNALIAMIAPILYNRWSKAVETGALERRSRAILGLALVAGSPLTVVIILAAPLIASLGKEEFTSAIAPIRILAVASVPLIFSRLMIPALLAFGRPELATYSGMIRLGVAVLSTAGIVWLGASVIVAAACGWLLSEWLIAIFLLASLNLDLLRPREIGA